MNCICIPFNPACQTIAAYVVEEDGTVWEVFEPCKACGSAEATPMYHPAVGMLRQDADASGELAPVERN